MGLPFKVATLIYCFNERDEVLLLQRLREPNRGLWSPCGGKVHIEDGESPYAAACREAKEELGISMQPAELHLTGIVSEHGYGAATHWLMFLYEFNGKLATLPAEHPEGAFSFFSRENINSLSIPQTDREKIWPLFWQHRGGFFSAHCHCQAGGANVWTLEESIPRF